MECLAVKRLPEVAGWIYEVKLDGYRAQAIRYNDGLQLLSRNGKPLTAQAPEVCAALTKLLPPGTAIDGELCALDASGRPSFHLMQNRKSSEAHLVFFALDLLYLRGDSWMKRSFNERRGMLERLFASADGEVQISIAWKVPLAQMLATVRKLRLEGVVAKQMVGWYEPGMRSGLWVKQRITLQQEFVIGGYTPGSNGIDALLLGFYRDGKLLFCSSVRNGFVPGSRRSTALSSKQDDAIRQPARGEPWPLGQGLIAEKMRDCAWLRPELLAHARSWSGPKTIICGTPVS